MKTGLLILLVVIAFAAIVFTGVITRDGEMVVPEGEGTIPLDAGDFEAFPLPDYAAKYVTDEYKSYFVEVEPGSRFTYSKWDPVSLCFSSTAIRPLDSSTGKWPKNCRPIEFG